MNDDDHIPHLNDSSFDLLNTNCPSRLFTTTLISKQDSNLPNSLNKNRRKSIIPSSHLPTKPYNMFGIDNELDNSLNKNCSSEQVEKQSQSNTNTASTNQTNDNYNNTDVITIEKNENLTNKEDIENEHSFDSFILQNFSQFSGEQDVNLWLQETTKKFNRLLIPRNTRFLAIPLLVEGEAQKIYIINRRNIKSFDDFYEILLSNFDKNNIQATQNHRHESIASQHEISLETKTSENKNSQTLVTFDNTHFSERPAMLHSTALVDDGAARLTGGIPPSQSTLIMKNTTSNNALNCDETTNLLRKVLLQTLIKNPKTFQGGKDNVNKWVEDLEQLFEMAHIPDTNRLHLISYSLRGEAFQWYKNNKNSLTTWPVFVHELKKAFTSSYHEELAFKKLESYTQGENQSIRNFCNEVLKLCTEADPAMSESSKLKHLLSKAKPTIQFEVRRKRPTTTKEFLEYAKEIEELYQLSNINTRSANDSNSNIPTFPLPSTTSSSIAKNYTNSSFSTSQPRNWERFSNSCYKNNYNNNLRTPNTLSSSNLSFRPRNPTVAPDRLPVSPQSQPNYSQKPFRSTQQRFSDNHTNNSNQLNVKQRSPTLSRNIPRENTVNNLTLSENSSQVNVQQQPETTNCCTQCNRPGHDALACSNF